MNSPDRHESTSDGSKSESPPDRKRHWSRLLPILAVALIGLALGIYTGVRYHADEGSASQEDANETRLLAELQERLVNAVVFPEDFRQVGDFSLIGTNGTQVDQGILDGTWSVMFFGYTYCPDVCPISLHVMTQVVRKLEESGGPVPQVVFVSVDPARDTPERLTEYIAYFDPRFVGITGDPAAIHEFSRSLGIVAAFTANDEDPENYIVDHTASMLLIDPDRRVRGKLNAPHEVDSIVSDFMLLHEQLQS